MSATYRVVATDRVSKKGLAPLRDDERFEVVRIKSSTEARFGSELETAAGLIVRSATTVDARLLEAAPELKVVGRAGVGVDNIDVAAASERGVAVVNAPGGNTVSAAELTMALLLSVARRVSEADRSMREGRWDRANLQGVELRGRTLGVVGAGRIGSAVADRCRAFGMRVIVHDPYLSADRLAELRSVVVEMDQLVAEADVITLHVPLTDETRGLIGESALLKMKKGAFLVNLSRGGVVDEAALARALIEGRIAGAGLDVYETEPLAPESPLLSAPNLVLTPHLGASTKEAQVQVALEVAANLRAALAFGDLTHAINAAEIARAAGLS
ncbi:MAG TPA: hydroxyacid dehydrogenase [Acidimicrobiia bacterium]|nr:hydroxyacid dehydrogenase [Acidimicrobiia bacterium]